MSEIMTEAQVNELPEGTPITVTWSGGNGPWPYVVAVHPSGGRYACLERDATNIRMRYRNLLGFVGTARPYTLVQLRD